MITLQQFLDSTKQFSGEIVTKLYTDESMYSFEFDTDCYVFTEKGKDKFKKILSSPVKIDNNVIILQDEKITFEELDFFLAVCAGYAVSYKTFNKWFKEV